jgi:DNA-binding beta-propeller fold protein YncE
MMKSGRMVPLIAGLILGTTPLAFADDRPGPAAVTFTVNDTPGHWFDAGPTWDLGGGRSLAIIKPGDIVHFNQSVGGPKDVESRHTVTSLIYPTGAGASEKIDQAMANKDNHHVTLNTEGLYVFVCKLHPYMLGAVVVNGEGHQGLYLGDSLHLLGVGDVPTTFDTNAGTGNPPSYAPTNVWLRVLRAFFIVTTPSNWKDYTKVGQPYKPAYPPVPVVLGSGAAQVNVADLNAALQGSFDGDVIQPQKRPHKKGIGEIWIDTAYELTAGKPEQFPGTMTVVSATSWKAKRKIALPEQRMNNGHNMWASHDQKQIYQTEWHGNSTYVINRHNGKLIQEIGQGQYGDGGTCHDPAHVMTRVDTQQVHVTCNGDDYVAEFNRLPSGLLQFNAFLDMSNAGGQTQPHAHWMGHDGKSMVTPNSNTNDATLFDFNTYTIKSQEPTGALPIASAMMPDGSKYYVSNYLGHSTSVMCGPPAPGTVTRTCKKPDGTEVTSGQKIKDIPLLLNGNYSPTTGAITGPIGGFPIQTPVSPDGKFVITGNTLTGTITIIDTKTDTLVKMIPCDPGCHGVNFGAKKRGGYYAYVTSKFANRMIVLDYDPNNDGKADDAMIAGAVVLAKDSLAKDDKIVGNKGQGGQGILPVPNVYNGWVQQLPIGYKAQLTRAQRNPIGPVGGGNPHGDRDDDHDDE